jgi:hypothetical protein
MNQGMVFTGRIRGARAQALLLPGPKMKKGRLEADLFRKQMVPGEDSNILYIVLNIKEIL